MTPSVYDAAPLTQQTVYAVSGFPGVEVGTTTYKTDLVLITNAAQATFTTGVFLIQNIVFGNVPAVRGLFTSARVASGGTRFFKTSASTTESGLIKAYYAERGGRVTKNIGQLLNYFQDD